jgi:hypothetical protein
MLGMRSVEMQADPSSGSIKTIGQYFAVLSREECSRTPSYKDALLGLESPTLLLH